MNAERGAARQRGTSPIRPAIELSDRQRAVLRAVVEDYVLTAVPVGSKALLGRYALGVSPATVRGAMAELEALGLLTHPHTSAGRVPSDLGYRIYVESLMREAELDETDRLMIRHQFSQVQLTSNEWLRLAASILAGSTRAASVVTPARSRRARFGHVQLVALADGTRLMVSSCSATATCRSDGSTARRWSEPFRTARSTSRPSTRRPPPSTPSWRG
jgi:heat-inducible transcriptional repressor